MKKKLLILDGNTLSGTYTSLTYKMDIRSPLISIYKNSSNLNIASSRIKRNFFFHLNNTYLTFFFLFILSYIGEQSICDGVFFHIVLDTLHDHVVHVSCDIQRGEPAGEANSRAN